MTQKEVFQKLRALGLAVSKRNGEFRVAIPGNSASAYFTEDLQDAYKTGCAMAAKLEQHSKMLLTMECPSASKH